MVTVRIGNLFDSRAQTLVNTVNCVGVMGKGIALEFKKRFPDMHDDYVRRCRQGEVHLGKPYLYRRSAPPWILNFPTKEHWRSVSRLDDIVRGLRYLERHYKAWGITSVAVPPLGCGQGQLEWSIVGPTLYRHLARLDIPVELYAPYGTPDDQLALGFLKEAPGVNGWGGRASKINPAWVALVEILARIEREPYHRPIGRIAFQKLVYFATSLGLPTGLRFDRGSYGPFSKDLKRLTARMVNNGLIQEQRLGRMFRVRPGPTYDDALRAYDDELAEWEPVIDRVTDLFLRIDTEQAEVAATVHFVAQALSKDQGSLPAEMDVLEEVRRWKQRRRPALDEQVVAEAIRGLNVLRWINVAPSHELPVSDDFTSDA